MLIFDNADLNAITKLNAKEIPIDAIEIAIILSGRAIGRFQTSTRIIIPPMPNKTFNSIFDPLSVITSPLTSPQISRRS